MGSERCTAPMVTNAWISCHRFLKMKGTSSRLAGWAAEKKVGAFRQKSLTKCLLSHGKVCKRSRVLCHLKSSMHFGPKLPQMKPSAETQKFDWLGCVIRFCNDCAIMGKEIDRITNLYKEAKENLEKKAHLQNQFTASEKEKNKN